jgi:hypothetical protein
MGGSESGKKLVVVATAALSVCVALCLCRLASADDDPPPWPEPSVVTKNAYCQATGQTCSTCPGQTTGCTSGIPATWSQGACVKDSMYAGMCAANTFSCGAQYNCDTGDPTGVQCWSGAMCK